MSTPNLCPPSQPAWYNPDLHPTLCIAGYPVPATILPIVVAIALIIFKLWQGQMSPKSFNSTRPDHKTSEFTTQQPPQLSLLPELTRLFACMTPLVISFLAANYLSICIGWRPLLLASDIVPPALHGGGYIGGMLFMIVWCGMTLPPLLREDKSRSQRRPLATLRYEVGFDAEAVGWTMVVELAIWMVLQLRLWLL